MGRTGSERDRRETLGEGKGKKREENRIYLRMDKDLENEGGG